MTDPGNNRVLVYEVAAITNGEDAINVLGQTLFTTSDAATTRGGLNNPSGLAYDSPGNRLFVADTGNNRVLAYDVLAATITNGENASNVLGQAVFTTSAAATTQTGLNGPVGLAYNSGITLLYVADSSNHRIVIQNVFGGALADGQAAVNVLGQVNFTSGTANWIGSVAANGVSRPQGLAFDGAGNRLWAVDNGNHRVLSYDVAGIVDGAAAVDLVGQVDGAGGAVFNTGLSNGGANSRGLNNPMGLALDATNHRLFVADSSNNRVLVYNLDSSNRLLDRQPDAVLGQADFTSAGLGGFGGGVNQAGLMGPTALAYDSTGNRLFVADTGSSRVLVYNVAAIANGENAVNVLGQANFTSSVAAGTQGGLNGPQGLAYDSGASRLFVADYNNNRVVVHNVGVGLIDDGQSATWVLGQASFASGGAATTQGGLNGPLGLAYDSTASRLFVADYNNHRVQVYDVAAITDGENAVSVLGQADFTSGSGATSAIRLSQPYDVAYDPSGRRLLVADYGNSRVVTYDVETINNGEAAVAVIGQADFASSDNNRGTGVAANTLNTPSAVEFDPSAGIVYIADYANNRALVFAASLAGGGIAVNGGAAYANTITTTLTLTATNATTALLSESSAFTGASFQPYTTTTPFTMTVGDGAKTVYARFRDSALDPSAAVSDTIILDATPPAAFALSSPATGAVTTTSGLTYSWAGSSDATSGLAKYQLYMDGTLNRDNISSATTSITATGVLTEGMHTWKVVATDNAGNARESSATWSLTLDATPPAAFALSSPVTGTITNTNSPAFSWAGSSDATSGLAKYQLYLDGTLNRDDISPGATAITATSALIDGLHTWKVVATDNAGNTRESSSSSVTVDTFAPVLSGVSVTGLTGAGATVTWASSEAASSQVEYGATSSYGSATTEADTTTRVVTHTVALTGLTPASAVHFRVKGRDHAGNWGLSTDGAFTAASISIYLPTLARGHDSGW